MRNRPSKELDSPLVPSHYLDVLGYYLALAAVVCLLVWRA